jgi:hypothetical protein
VDVRFELHDALLPVGEYARIRDVLAEVENVAQSLGDRHRLGRAYSYISHNAWIDLADNERAADYAARALQIADAEGNRTLDMVVSFYLGQINLSRGDLPASVEAFTRCIACAAVASPRPLEIFFAVNARSWSVYAHADLGLFDEGLAIAEEGLRIAEQSANPILVVTGRTGLGHILSWRDRDRHQMSGACPVHSRCP